MINFLSPEAKQAVKREYFTRVVSVWMLLLAAVATVGAALLGPTYVLLIRQLDALSQEIITLEKESDTEQYLATREALSGAHDLALQLAVSYSGPTPSQILTEVRKSQTDAIVIYGFSYERAVGRPDAVTVRGTASTREALAQFTAALERNPLFARAEVPVSDLASDRELPFTLTIVLAEKKT
ncbi:hypothetical protein HY416_01760 [Candidatus Kaiserbacteria bacterium]|nr:hypothetical protein [Candidatus Kaiserbacteria bacterium]